MALREFKDPQGTPWLAWDVPPPRLYQAVRSGDDRRVAGTPGYAPERRKQPERRRRSLMAGLERGWICFESPTEKRRLAPPPEGWDAASDEELVEMCRRGVPLGERALSRS